jgi:hypothetical protein
MEGSNCGIIKVLSHFLVETEQCQENIRIHAIRITAKLICSVPNFLFKLSVIYEGIRLRSALACRPLISLNTEVIKMLN